MAMAASILRVGLRGIGLEAYWPQFAGLGAQLDGYVRQTGERLARCGAAVEHLGMVDTPQHGVEAGQACRRAYVDLLIVYVTTYALSSTVLPMMQRARVCRWSLYR
jgi:L-arabinose isomerase